MVKVLKKKSKKERSNEGRDYKDEYKKFQSSEKQMNMRVKRNRDRNRAEREGRVRKGDGNDLHHASDGTTRVEPASVNRGRKEKSRLKGSKRRPR